MLFSRRLSGNNSQIVFSQSYECLLNIFLNYSKIMFSSAALTAMLQLASKVFFYYYSVQEISFKYVNRGSQIRESKRNWIDPVVLLFAKYVQLCYN